MRISTKYAPCPSQPVAPGRAPRFPPPFTTLHLKHTLVYTYYTFSTPSSTFHFIWYPYSSRVCVMAEKIPCRNECPAILGQDLCDRWPQETQGKERLRQLCSSLRPVYRCRWSELPLRYLLVRRIFIAPLLLGGAGLDIVRVNYEVTTITSRASLHTQSLSHTGQSLPPTTTLPPLLHACQHYHHKYLPYLIKVFH